MDILQQQMINICSRDILICENVLGVVSLVQVILWGKLISTLQAVGKRPNDRKGGFAGSSRYGVKMKLLKNQGL